MGFLDEMLTPEEKKELETIEKYEAYLKGMSKGIFDRIIIWNAIVIIMMVTIIIAQIVLIVLTSMGFCG